MGEIYSGGTNAEKWGRAFIAQRGAQRIHALRELLPILMAVDTMLLVDRDPGVINRVALEKLCRKAMGIVEAWRKVEQESDGNRPPNAGKQWKSKVNYEEARRIDPSMLDESLFRIRDLEDEVRKETEREAGLLKAKIKLEKHKGDE